MHHDTRATKSLKNRCDCGQSVNLGALKLKIKYALMAKELHRNRETVSDSKRRFANEKMSSKMVLRFLTDEHKQRFICSFK